MGPPAMLARSGLPGLQLSWGTCRHTQHTLLISRESRSIRSLQLSMETPRRAWRRSCLPPTVCQTPNPSCMNKMYTLQLPQKGGQLMADRNARPGPWNWATAWAQQKPLVNEMNLLETYIYTRERPNVFVLPWLAPRLRVGHTLDSNSMEQGVSARQPF